LLKTSAAGGTAAVMEMTVLYSFAALPRVLQTSAAGPNCSSAVVAALPLGRAALLWQSPRIVRREAERRFLVFSRSDPRTGIGFFLAAANDLGAI